MEKVTTAEKTNGGLMRLLMPDQGIKLMMEICDSMSIKHRVVFEGVPLEAGKESFYLPVFQVSEACDKSGWITMLDLKGLILWLGVKAR
jgi:hypothetical protein